MTIFFPDVSAYQRGLVIQPNTVFLWAKATEGSSYVDNTYAGFKAQAASVGAGFGAYHVLYAGNGSAQADHAFSVVGHGVPLFVDVEPVGTSYPTAADVIAFKTRYRALGGTVEAMYYPKWYWTNQGSPNLAQTGLQLISSGYPAGYSDTDANWNPYGGLTPFQWQFSDSYSYGGLSVDFNAYKGTIQEYLVAIGAEVQSPPPPTTTLEEDDMAQAIGGQVDLSWSTGTKHVVQVSFDGAGLNAGNVPDLRVVLQLETGPVVLNESWKPTPADKVIEFTQYAPTAYGITLEPVGTPCRFSAIVA